MAGTPLEDIVKRLSIPDLETKSKVEAATALRDTLDLYTNGQIYPFFLKRVMPIFINILRGPCIFLSNSPEQVGRMRPGDGWTLLT